MPKNGRFTWSNKQTRPGHIATRLDHFLVSTSFLQKNFLPISRIISSATSYHKPISLSFSTPTNLGPIPFSFNPLWLNNAKTLELISIARNQSFSRSPSFIWESKLQSIHSSLKKWAATYFSKPSKLKTNLQSDLTILHTKMEKEEITHEILTHEKTLNGEILKATRNEEESLRIKSRQLWLKGGDKKNQILP